ncbi:MAG: hypothetical protein OXG27_13410 [Chloroflexi bacterium]|nr:hypothetical protein [Chloroflexota bacterium]MDE2805410.1 hypothetical protein [Gemmatimonadota bacterium]
MKSTQWLNALLFVLLVGIGGQSVLAVSRARQASLPSEPVGDIVVGDTLLALTGSLEGNVPATIRFATDAGIATVLYVFHPDCVHCHAVAPEWAEHLSADHTNRPKVRRIAVTNDSVGAAAAYAERFGWDVDVLSVEKLTPADREFSLFFRTPWVFVFDSVGVLRFEGHGRRLEQMIHALDAL